MEWTSIHSSTSRADAGTESTVYGRIRSIRHHKNVLFLDLVDNTGQIQLVIERTAFGASFDDILAQSRGTYLVARGKMDKDGRGNPEVRVNNLEIIAQNTLNLPTPWELDGSNPSFGDQIFSFPEMYVANPQRAAILKIKTDFVSALHHYFQTEGFVWVEPPILTNKTLYGAHNAIHAQVHGERIYLSQCATFELEPLALAFGKVYTLSPAFRNEPAGSKRHLAEYTHAKAEVLFGTLESLITLSSTAIHYAMSRVLTDSHKEIALLGSQVDLEALLPSRHEHMTYDEALQIAQQKGSQTQWGEGLKKSDEVIITSHAGNKYVWVHLLPFASEGFPYKRSPSNSALSMTCDLIAPHGAGEMVGVAEKITDPEELIINLIEKGQRENLAQYWNYIALREQGMPPHGGIGAAPERILYGLLGLDHIRLTKPWPRYPDRKIVSSTTEFPDFGSTRLQSLIEKYHLRTDTLK